MIQDSIIKLHGYCKCNDFKGYSLYDSHNGFIPLGKMGKHISFYGNQVVKRSPVNFRPLMGIKHDINPKGVGLFLKSYLMLNDMGILQEDMEEQIHTWFRWLMENPTKGYKGYSWGYHYDWPKRDGSMVPAFTPSSVVTGFNSRAILDYWKKFKSKEAEEVLYGAAEFILTEIPQTKTEDGLCFSYIPIQPDLTVNANLLAAEVLAYSDFINGNTVHLDKIKSVMDFTMNRQNEDGSWFYSFHMETGKPKNQIDFHQGYVLESILRICQYSNLSIEDYKKEVDKGLDFYFRNQFSSDGKAYWRYPKVFPIDIHNQSQGVITFSVFADRNEKYLPFAERIAKWTIENMQGRRGNFYYQKYKILTNKTSYMRWNQAWTLLALSTLMSKKI